MASLAELAGDVLGRLSDQGEEHLAALEVVLLFEDDSGRGTNRLLTRLPEHEAVEGRFLADASWEPLEGGGDAVNDLVSPDLVIEMLLLDIFTFSHSCPCLDSFLVSPLLGFGEFYFIL